jgi:hypothetical protein
MDGGVLKREAATAADAQHGNGRLLRVVGDPRDDERAPHRAGTSGSAAATARLLPAVDGARSLVIELDVEALGWPAENGSVASVQVTLERGSPRLAEQPCRLFVREGEDWSVRYSAGAFRVRDSNGMRYLAELLARPGREFAALMLVAAINANLARPAMTARTRADAGLQGPGTADAGDERFKRRSARARGEIDALTAQLGAALGLNHRSRRVPGHAERARQSVTKAIRTAIRRLGEHDPALAAHLNRTIQTGAICRYDPDPRTDAAWTL